MPKDDHPGIAATVAERARRVRAELAAMLEEQIEAGAGWPTAAFWEQYYRRLWELAVLHATGALGGGSSAAVRGLAAIERLLDADAAPDGEKPTISPAVSALMEKLRNEGMI